MERGCGCMGVAGAEGVLVRSGDVTAGASSVSPSPFHARPHSCALTWSMTLLTPSSTACSCAGVRPLPCEKSKRSLDASTVEPRWSSPLPTTSRSA